MGAFDLAQVADMCILLAYVALDSAASPFIRQKTADVLHEVLTRLMGTSAVLKTEVRAFLCLARLHRSDLRLQEVQLIRKLGPWLRKLSHPMQRDALLLFTASISPSSGLGQWLAWTILCHKDVDLVSLLPSMSASSDSFQGCLAPAASRRCQAATLFGEREHCSCEIVPCQEDH